LVDKSSCALGPKGPSRYKGRAVTTQLVTSKSSPVMSPHQYHTVSSFRESCLFRPTCCIVVSCETFNCFLHLSPTDTDLHFVQGCCFSCRSFSYCAKKCGMRRRCKRLVCSQLPDPYSKSLLSLLSLLLLTCSLSVLDINCDLGFRCGGSLGWEDILDMSGWGETTGAPSGAEWAQGGEDKWAECAPPLVKVEEVELVLKWLEDQESVLWTTQAGTPYLSPPLSESIRLFVHCLY
jgi:hypothetical protein